MGDLAEKTTSVQPSAAEIFAPPTRETPTDKMVERYAQAYVDTGQWNAAYRRCYDCSGMTSATVYRAAHALSQHPGVIKRVRELRQAAAERSICTVAEVLQAQLEIATANPADVVRVSEHNCRHCYGVDGGYQWRDQDELAVAIAKALDEAAERNRVPKMPDASGGFGFTVHRRPNPDCEHCAGVGEPRVHITDSRELVGGAARLVKSVKQDRFGAITVELHDPQAAWDKIARILGAYKDGLAITTPSKPAEGPPADLPKEKVADAYLALVR